MLPPKLRPYGLLKLGKNALNAARAVNSLEPARPLVKINERLCLLLVCPQPNDYFFLAIVFPVLKLDIGMKVTDVFVLRRLEKNIIYLAADRATSPSGHSPH
jgi:hypothetical protein